MRHGGEVGTQRKPAENSCVHSLIRFVNPSAVCEIWCHIINTYEGANNGIVSSRALRAVKVLKKYFLPGISHEGFGTPVHRQFPLFFGVQSALHFVPISILILLFIFSFSPSSIWSCLLSQLFFSSFLLLVLAPLLAMHLEITIQSQRPRFPC